MNDIRKATHHDADKMRAVLKTIGAEGVRKAIKEWRAGKRPSNYGKFRCPRGWVILESGKDYPHRPLIALACELCGEPVMNPNNFGLPNDELCKKWFEEQGFTLTKLA